MKDYPYVPGWRQNKENNKPAIKHSVLMFTTHGIAEGEWVGNEWVQYRWSCKVKDTEVLYWMHLEDLTQLEKEGDCFQQEQPEVDFEDKFAKFLERKDAELGANSWSEEDLRELAMYFYSDRNNEQPNVDLEKEMDRYYDSPLWEGEDVSWMTYTRIAHHFYELGQQNRLKISKNSPKELRKEVIKFNQDHFDELHSDMDTIDIVHIIAVHFFELGLNARKED